MLFCFPVLPFPNFPGRHVPGVLGVPAGPSPSPSPICPGEGAWEGQGPGSCWSSHSALPLPSAGLLHMLSGGSWRRATSSVITSPLRSKQEPDSWGVTWVRTLQRAAVITPTLKKLLCSALTCRGRPGRLPARPPVLPFWHSPPGLQGLCRQIRPPGSHSAREHLPPSLLF